MNEPTGTVRPAARTDLGPRSFRDALSTWLERHAQTLVASLGRLVRQPFATLLTIAVLGLALALPAALYVVVKNVRTVTAGLENTVQLSVYLEQPMTAENARKAARTIAARDDVRDARLITPTEGLKEFEALSGFGDALKALKDNPLPYAIVVQPAESATTATAVETLTRELRALPDVEIVQVDTEWVRRLEAIVATVRQAVELAALILALGVLAIVGNTVRLDIDARRSEIEIIKLVGGSDAFVRRPFLYSGVWYGLGGALVAAVILEVAVQTLGKPVADVARLYASGFRLGGLSASEAGLLLVAGVALGWLGSWIAAARHLRRIEPRA